MNAISRHSSVGALITFVIHFLELLFVITLTVGDIDSARIINTSVWAVVCLGSVIKKEISVTDQKFEERFQRNSIIE